MIDNSIAYLEYILTKFRRKHLFNHNYVTIENEEC
nr:MAG TPA: hypothetical protein [Caudoviricetes sp.]